MTTTAPLSKALLWSSALGVLVWKVLWLAVLAHGGHIGLPGGCAFCGIANDSHTYFEPIEALLANGDYASYLRMPGYGAIYLLVRAFLDVPAAYDALVILQLLVSTVSVVVLASVVERLSGSRRWFFITLTGYTLFFGLHGYDLLLLTESFSASALIFSFACLLGYARSGGRHWALLAGVFAMWLVFLKPVCLPLLLASTVAVAFIGSGKGKRAKAALAFLAPFIIADIPWALHNAEKDGGLHPLLRNLYLASDAPDVEFEAMNFVRSFGGAVDWWEHPQAEIWYFNLYDPTKGGPGDPSSIKLPDAVMHLPGAAEGMPALAEEVRAALDTTVDAGTRMRRQTAALQDLRAWRARYEQAAPFDHHVLARLRHLKRMVVGQPGSPFPFRLAFADMPLHEKAVKLFLRGSAVLLPFIGALAALLLPIGRGDHRPLRLLVAFTVGFGLGIFPFLFLGEPRYWVCFSAFSFLACAWAWSRWCAKRAPASRTGTTLPTERRT